MRRFDIRISIPELNSHREDVPLLVSHFVDEFLQTDGAARRVERGALYPTMNEIQVWQARDWSGANGNVGGLRKQVEAWLRKRLRSMPTTDQAEADQHESRKGGRPPGSKKISDHELAMLLHQFMEDPSRWTADRLFDQIDKRIKEAAKHGSPTPMARTQGALKRRVQNISDEAILHVWGAVPDMRALRRSIAHEITALWTPRRTPKRR